MNESIIPLRISFDKDLKNNKSKIKVVENRPILVIGGAGTIGSNYIKEILKYKPSKIVIVDINENGLAELTRDLRSSNLLDYNPEYITYPVNLNSKIFDKIFVSDDFFLVANFAAHKHVRSEKDLFSIEALIKNNIFGAIKLLELCDKNPPNFFFSVSTDKAANPVNVMGASKLIMEKLIMSKKNNFRVSTARFANVAFSNGSLLDGFLYRFQKKQPLSCPNNIKRFFVTPKQSGEICLLATFLGDSGNIFFPKLDFKKDQIYFSDLAKNYINSLGFKPKIFKSESKAKNFKIDIKNKYYPIYFFKSNTSGEKSFEEFYTESEDYNLNKYYSLGYINSVDEKINFSSVKLKFNTLFNNTETIKTDILNLIKQIIPNFRHIEKGKHLDQSM